MKTIFALPLLALGLAACETYPPGFGYPEPYEPYEPSGSYSPAYPQQQGSYRAIGTEPFWDLEIGRDMVFTDRGNNVRVVQPTPRPTNGASGETYQTARIEANIVRSSCSDGMSDRTYPDTVHVRVDGRAYHGCGAPAGFYSQVGESGLPNVPGPPVPMLSQTNWRVVAINGRATPPRNFYMNFMPTMISAKFGCNSVHGRFSQRDTIMAAEPLVATRMACPDMSFETESSAVLAQPMTISGLGDRLTLSNVAGSIELIRAH